VKILFWGTPAFAVPSLRALDDEGFDVVGVVTQPDRPAGRGRRLKPSAIKEVALEKGIPVFTPDRPRTDEFLDSIRALEPDLSVVVAYGHILRPDVLDIPPLGSINIHASLLPALRGAAPINWAIARCHEETGVTVMRMAEAMDAGDVIYQVPEPILSDQTASELTVRLSEIGAEALIEALALLAVGAAEEVAQDHDAATYAPEVDREIAQIRWDGPAREVSAHVRAMDAVPGAWSTLAGAAVKLFRPTPVSFAEGPDAVTPSTNGGPPAPSGPAAPGTVIRIDPAEGVLVRVADGGVAFQEVQPPGRRRMSASDWINGRGVKAGQRFG
jgi:methionyl-tRNA formyltransferase